MIETEVAVAGAAARRLVPPRTRSRCVSVLVDQSAEQVVPVDARRGGSAADEIWIGAVWRSELERAVRAMPVVVVGIDAQDALEMAPSEDQNPVEAVAAHGSHPALSEGVRVRRLDRCPDHLDPLGAKDLVEAAAELPVPIVDQQPEPPLMLAQLHEEVAGLLGHPGAVRVGCAGDELEPARRRRDEEEDVDPRKRLHREEIAGERAGSL